MRTFTFVRDAGPEDHRALPRVFKMGEQVKEFTGHDYGCARDDMMYGGIESISCSLDGGTPSFTVPVEYLADEAGQQPMGPYMRVKNRSSAN